MKNTTNLKFLLVYDYYEPNNKAVYSSDERVLGAFIDLFQYLSNKNVDVYAIRDLNNCISKNEYLAQFKFNSEIRDFEEINTVIIPDCIWDKTLGSNFPIFNTDNNIINTKKFKALESNKWIQSQIFKDFFPQNLLCNDIAHIKEYAQKINTSRVVIKPLHEYGGKGISFFEKQDILKENVDLKTLPTLPFLIQSFSDTSKGLSGVCKGIHDLRFVYLNKQLNLCILRQAATGQLRANYAQGGTFEKIPLTNIPQYILDFLKPIANQIMEEYSNPYFSIDIGIENEKPVVFELTGAKVSFPINEWDNESFYEQFYQHIISKIS